MKYQYLLWDVDGTLLDFSYSQRISVTNCLEIIGVTVSDEMVDTYSQINDSWWRRLELGEVTKDELLSGRFIDLFRTYEIDCPDVEAFCRQYERGLGKVFRYTENSLEVCQTLKNQYRQFVVTNGVAVTQKEKLSLSGFDKLMDGIFISEEIGVPKPHKDFFDTCFAHLEDKYGVIDRGSVLIIGDSLSSDMKGGNNAGIDTCWYNPSGCKNDTDVTVTYEIQSLQDVYKVL